MLSLLKPKVKSDAETVEKSSADFPLTVQQQLDYAQPAESARTPMVTQYGAGADYGYLRSMVTHVDGMWLCCCGAENELIHWTGPYPFKYLKCGKCEHVLCGRCDTTQILTPLAEHTRNVVLDHNGPRLAQVCVSCGLSYRSMIVDNMTTKWLPREACQCGVVPNPRWLKYAIKPPGAYKIWPKKTVQELKKKRQGKEAEQKLEPACENAHKHDLSQSISARQPCRDELRNAEHSPASVWEHPGFRYNHLPEASHNPRNSILQTPKSFLGRNSADPAAISRDHRPVQLNLGDNETFLKRSGALRRKDGSPYVARSASYRDTPISARPKLISRAETWAASASYLELREEAEDYLMVTLGTEKYNQVKGSAEGEQLIHDAIREQFSRSPATAWQCTVCCSSPSHVKLHAQPGAERTGRLVQKASTLTMHAPKPIRRAVTYDQLLNEADEWPLGPLIRIQTESSSPICRRLSQRSEVDTTESGGANWADTWKLYQNLNSDACEKVGEEKEVNVEMKEDKEIPDEDDWAESYKLFQQSLAK